jgi:hypothetical protein
MKRLVFCFDGTWNRLDAQYSTNVVLTAESVLPLTQENVAQVVFYDEGVGTSKFESLSGGMFGAGLLKNMADGYRFLIFNYSPGDEIYVFGFSRGAYILPSSERARFREETSMKYTSAPYRRFCLPHARMALMTSGRMPLCWQRICA